MGPYDQFAWQILWMCLLERDFLIPWSCMWAVSWEWLYECQDNKWCWSGDGRGPWNWRSCLDIFRFLRLECQCASHLEGTFLIDFPVNQSSGFILQNFHRLSNDRETVIQHQLCLDSTNLLWPVEQKCHNHLRALEIINHPPDEAVYHAVTAQQKQKRNEEVSSGKFRTMRMTECLKIFLDKVAVVETHIPKKHNANLKHLKTGTTGVQQHTVSTFTLEMVCHMLFLSSWHHVHSYFFFRDNSCSCLNALDRLEKSWFSGTSSWACIRMLSPGPLLMTSWRWWFLTRSPILVKWWPKNAAGKDLIIGTVQWWTMLWTMLFFGSKTNLINLNK